MRSREDTEVPASVRREVADRDGGACRVCGQTPGVSALHHIDYRSQGGLHVPANLITVCWFYGAACHDRVHSSKQLWQPILHEVVKHSGINALQLKRWAGR